MLFDDLGEEDELPFFNFRRFIKSTGENSHLPKLESFVLEYCIAHDSYFGKPIFSHTAKKLDHLQFFKFVTNHFPKLKKLVMPEWQFQSASFFENLLLNNKH
jgi:hypothetical protein